ncbi:hypothetical protein EKG40_14865 [Pseudomonas moorei]|nr:hypothetical protein EKG40_14865 [Pseudomonas moorei]
MSFVTFSTIEVMVMTLALRLPLISLNSSLLSI